MEFDPVLQRLSPTPATDDYGTWALTYPQSTGRSAQMQVPLTLRVGSWVMVRHQVYSFNVVNAFAWMSRSST